MYNPSFDDLKEKGVNPYTLSLFLAKRARDIVDGDMPMVDTVSLRPVSIALEEFFEDKIEPIQDNFDFEDDEEREIVEKFSQVLDDDDYYDDEMSLEEEEVEEEEEEIREEEEDLFDEDEFLDDEEWDEDVE